jgi:hypothetical protein
MAIHPTAQENKVNKKDKLMLVFFILFYRGDEWGYTVF